MRKRKRHLAGSAWRSGPEVRAESILVRERAVDSLKVQLGGTFTPSLGIEEREYRLAYYSWHAHTGFAVFFRAFSTTSLSD